MLKRMNAYFARLIFILINYFTIFTLESKNDQAWTKPATRIGTSLLQKVYELHSSINFSAISLHLVTAFNFWSKEWLIWCSNTLITAKEVSTGSIEEITFSISLTKMNLESKALPQNRDCKLLFFNFVNIYSPINLT